MCLRLACKKGLAIIPIKPFTFLGIIPNLDSGKNISKANIIYKNARQDDPLQRRPCVRLAYDKLGWHAETDLSTGLNRTIDYFKKELVNS